MEGERPLADSHLVLTATPDVSIVTHLTPEVPTAARALHYEGRRLLRLGCLPVRSPQELPDSFMASDHPPPLTGAAPATPVPPLLLEPPLSWLFLQPGTLCLPCPLLVLSACPFQNQFRQHFLQEAFPDSHLTFFPWAPCASQFVTGGRSA